MPVLTRVNFSICSIMLTSIAAATSSSSVTSSLRVFRHVAQIPEGNDELMSEF